MLDHRRPLVDQLQQLIAAVAHSRQRFLAEIDHLTTAQGAFRGSKTGWSVAEITEHLILAEQGGINLIWKATEGVRTGRPVWAGESPNRGQSIEEVVERTWREREVAPESATPRMGGPIGYWAAALRSCRPLLESLGKELGGLDLSEVIYPHVISGPLDARQRLEFLRFHLDRHRRQVTSLKAHPAFP